MSSFHLSYFKNILLSAGGSIASATVQLELVEDAALTPTEIQLFHSRNRSISNPLRFSSFQFFFNFLCRLNLSVSYNQFRTHFAEFFPHKYWKRPVFFIYILIPDSDFLFCVNPRNTHLSTG
jgi:hypothetical protein